MKHLMFGTLVLILACAPAIAEETSAEKNEVTERYVLVEEQVGIWTKANGNKKSLLRPLGVLSTSFRYVDVFNRLSRPKLFILYRNLKLCD